MKQPSRMALLLALLLGVVLAQQQQGGVAHAASEPRDLVFNITVPDFDVKGEDSYVCTTVKLPDRSMKLVGVEALARQEVVHHILLFGAFCLSALWLSSRSFELDELSSLLRLPRLCGALRSPALEAAAAAAARRAPSLDNEKRAHKPTGCDTPHVEPKAGAAAVWDCKSRPTCGGMSEMIMYGWGRNASKLQLPDGVGFSVGGASAVRWIVAQVISV